MTQQPNEVYEFCLDPDLIKATLKIPFWREKSRNAIKRWLLNDSEILLVVIVWLVVVFFFFYMVATLCLFLSPYLFEISLYGERI